MRLLHKSETLDNVRLTDIERGDDNTWHIRLRGTRQGNGRIRLELVIEDKDVISLIHDLLKEYAVKVPQLAKELKASETKYRKLNQQCRTLQIAILNSTPTTELRQIVAEFHSQKKEEKR